MTIRATFEQLERYRQAIDKNRLLTRKEVEEIFGLSVRFLEIAAMKREGPSFIKLGHRTVRYRNCDVEYWIEQQSQQVSS